jgi:hypothetical protein
MFYFGCVETTGHYWWAPGPEPCKRPALCPWVLIDLAALPLPRDHRDADQNEGDGYIRRKDGWTLLGFWDRSVDDRFGSNSVFVVEEDLSANEMMAQARETFPSIWARFPFEVRIRDERQD